MVPRGREGPQYGKLFYGCFNGKRGREVRATLGKNIYEFSRFAAPDEFKFT
jgi:hypothetical protein